jgi:hypothetical protein
MLDTPADSPGQGSGGRNDGYGRRFTLPPLTNSPPYQNSFQPRSIKLDGPLWNVLRTNCGLRQKKSPTRSAGQGL